MSIPELAEISGLDIRSSRRNYSVFTHGRQIFAGKQYDTEAFLRGFIGGRELGEAKYIMSDYSGGRLTEAACLERALDFAADPLAAKEKHG